MRDALRSVIEDGNIESVGGFITHISAAFDRPETPVFRYQSYLESHGHKPVTNTTKPTSMLQSVEDSGGSYRFSVLVPQATGIAALGVYIVESQTGALFLPSSSWQPEIFRPVSCPEFIERVYGKFFVRLTGMPWGVHRN